MKATGEPNEPPSSPFPERISKAEINDLPLIAFPGEVVIVDTDEAVKAAARDLGKHRRLGFDTETKPVFRRLDQPRLPALLQLGSHDRVYLFQLRKLTKVGPVFRILANPRIIKAGVAPHGDIRALALIQSFKPAGFTDISLMAANAGIITAGLRNLCGILLGGRVSKSAQLSNWESPTLSPKQVLYAATDAWISLRIYEEFVRHGVTDTPRPPKPKKPSRRHRGRRSPRASQPPSENGTQEDAV